MTRFPGAPRGSYVNEGVGSPFGSPRVEPVDTLAEAIDEVMPVLKEIDPDWQSRWDTAGLLLEELRVRGYTLVAGDNPIDGSETVDA